MKKNVVLLLSAFTLSAFAVAGAAQKWSAKSPPIVWAFEVTPTTAVPGETVTVSWIVIAADKVTIDNGVGNVGLAGTKTVALSEAGTATFTLTAKNAAGSSIVQRAVEVLEFSKLFGGSYDDEGACVRATADGGYIVTGYVSTKSFQGEDVCLIKTDANGEIVWQKTFGGTGTDKGRDVQQTPDGGFIIAAESPDVDLIRTDALGNKLWSKQIAWPAQNAYCVWPLTDGGFLVGAENSHLLKTDASGNTLWDKSFVGVDRFYAVRPASDGGFILTGQYWQNTTIAYELFLLKIDVSGNLIWRKQFGGDGWQFGYSVVEVPGGGYLVVGTTMPITGWDSIWLIRTDAAGNKVWEKTISNDLNTLSADAYAVVATEDGGFVVAGSYQSGTLNAEDILLFKIDSGGAILWSKLVGVDRYESARSIARASDGAFVVTGTSATGPTTGRDILLMKIR